MLKAIIADDEYDANDLLENALSVCCPNVKVVEKTFSVNETEKAIKTYEIDILFLDISMPGGDVFEMLDRVKPFNFYIIFVTAYNQYALKAIKHSAIDYILKPLDIVELKNAVQKVEKLISDKARINQNIYEFINNINQQNKKLEIVTNNKIVYVRIGDIIRFEADGNYVRIISSSGENYYVSKKLKDYQEFLSGSSFFRVHHSYLININHVKSIYTKDSMIVMSDNKIVPLSRKNKEEFLILMSNIR
jgi:two-component system LytT family response regulator